MEKLNNHLISEICKHLTKVDIKQFRLSSNLINKSIKKDCHSFLIQEVLKQLEDCMEIIPFLTIGEILSIINTQPGREKFLTVIEKIQAKYPKKHGWSLMLKNKYNNLKYLNIDPY